MKTNKNTKYQIYIYDFIKHHKNYIKESTYYNYMNIINNHLSKDFYDVSLKNFNNFMLNEYIIDKLNNGSKNEDKLKQKTVRDIMVVVKLSLRYAFKNNIINSFDLTVKFPKNNCDLLPTTFNKYDLNKLIKYLQQNITSFNLGLLLVIFSGLRIGEICALKYSDFNIKKKTFTVDKTLQRIYTSQTKSKIIISSPKTSSSIREVPINDVLLQIIKTLKYNKDDYIISKKTKPTEPRVLRSRFNTILKKLKISPIKFHALRHTFATKCIENNIDYKTISVILGHSSINTTLNLYVHPNLQQKKKAINKLSKLLLT